MQLYTCATRNASLLFQVRVGSVVSASEDGTITSGIRVGWSTDDSSLHLGENTYN